MSRTVERDSSSRPAPQNEGAWAGWRYTRDFWRLLTVSGDTSVTSGEGVRAFFVSMATIAVLVGAVCTENVITFVHERWAHSIVDPIIWEGSSWCTFMLFSWIPWLAFCYAPIDARPRWRIGLIHLGAAVLFSVCHVAGFAALRKLIYWLAGSSYDFWRAAQFLYEFRKDAIGYVLVIAIFWVATLVVRKSIPPELETNPFFDIRDGARLLRVTFDDILAVTSAGNYVEFSLRDGRKPLMRKPLSAMEDELSPRGFVRTHRSWIVNGGAVTALKPEGSGDYTVELGPISAPLSRRFPEALARLRRA